MKTVVRWLIINIFTISSIQAQTESGPAIKEFFQRFMKTNNSLIVNRTQEELSRKSYRYEEGRSTISVEFGAEGGYEHTKEYGIDAKRNFGIIDGRSESFPSAAVYVAGKKPIYDGGMQDAKINMLKAKYQLNQINTKKTKLAMSHGANHMMTNFFKHLEIENEYKKQEKNLDKVRKIASRMRKVRAITRFEYENVKTKLSVLRVKRSKNKLQLSFYRFKLSEYINLKNKKYKNKLLDELSLVSETGYKRKGMCKTEKVDLKELGVQENLTLAEIRGLQGGLKPQIDFSVKAENKVRRNLEDETFDGRVMLSIRIPLGEHVRRGHLYDKYLAHKRLNRQQYEKAKKERTRMDGSDLVLLRDYRTHYKSLKKEIKGIKSNKFIKFKAVKRGGIALGGWLDLRERLSSTELDYITTKWRIVYLSLRSQIACDGELI